MPLPSKKQSHSFGTKKRSLRSKLQLARAAKEKVRKLDDESRHHAGVEAGDLDLDLVPGPSICKRTINTIRRMSREWTNQPHQHRRLRGSFRFAMCQMHASQLKVMVLPLM
ncbi:hypothetical protein LSAT2_029923 [Lamellibrachia satsuma]|nr:hypothetical protein LSAT2_029923 [Lamellibrachia satsuma]